MLLLLKAAESVARYVKVQKKPLRVFWIFFCSAQIAIPPIRSGVILNVQSLAAFARKNVVILSIMYLILFVFFKYSGYSVPVDEEPSQRTHRRKKKVNKGRWTKDEVCIRKIANIA